MEVGGQRHAPPALPPGKTWYPLYRRLGGPQGRSGGCGKSRPPPGFDPRDRPVRSESLYRLRYPAHNAVSTRVVTKQTLGYTLIQYRMLYCDVAYGSVAMTDGAVLFRS